MVIGIELLLIAVFCILIGVNAFVFGHRSGERKADGNEKDEIEILMETVAKSQAENAALRQRLEVLERLATDEDGQLAREIEQLKPRGEDRPGA